MATTKTIESATSLENYRVPTAPFKKIVERYLHEQGTLDAYTGEWMPARMDSASLKCGLARDTLGRIMKRESILFDTADRIMTKLGFALMWHEPPYDEIYWQGKVPPDKSKPLRCTNPHCEDGWFSIQTELEGPSYNASLKRKYCSDACVHMHWNYSHGRRTPPDERMKPRVCVYPTCRKTFVAEHPKSGKKKYCSHACRVAHGYRLRKGIM